MQGAEVALELGGVVPAPLPMVRVVAVSPCIVELRVPRVQYMRGGVRALGGLVAHVGCSSVAVDDRRRGLAGDTVVAHR
jgi:hypothetical protein